MAGEAKGARNGQGWAAHAYTKANSLRLQTNSNRSKSFICISSAAS